MKRFLTLLFLCSFVSQIQLASAGDTCSAPPLAANGINKNTKVKKSSAKLKVSSSEISSKSSASTSVCFSASTNSCFAPKQLCEKDMEIAKIAWKYFENNYQAKTGLVNSVDGYPSTTMWDTASALAGTIAARQLEIITEKDFDDRITALLATLNTMKLYQDEVPNKAYNASTAEMGDYANKPTTDGIGYSALDLARLISWLDILSCHYPKHKAAATSALLRWKYCNLAKDGQLYGAYFDKVNKKNHYIQEGRMGYEQYAGKMLNKIGFSVETSLHYDNEYKQTINIYDTPIAYDVRDPRKLGAYNYVVTESYALDAIEFGLDKENASLVKNVFEVQKKRWEDTGIVTAVSEDNVDRAPYFVYNTIFAAGSPWNTITDQGADQSKLKSTSTKAAFSLAALYPDDPYAQVLYDKISSAYDPAKGWYSGVYENGLGYNKAISVNTNGIILEIMMYKMYGAIHAACDKCKEGLSLVDFSDKFSKDEEEAKCLPGSDCKNTQASK